MDVALSVLICLFYVVAVYSGVPPDICFERFKWQDCGLQPKPVTYYYHSGSRCEVGIWRGCLPNSNMFVDEYDCVQTCIFGLRARPDDFHNLQEENKIVISYETANEFPMVTTDTSITDNSTTMAGNMTDTTVVGATGTDAVGTDENGHTGDGGGQTNDDGGQTNDDGGQTSPDDGQTSSDGLQTSNDGGNIDDSGTTVAGAEGTTVGPEATPS